jgi:hypothetical protein
VNSKSKAGNRRIMQEMIRGLPGDTTVFRVTQSNHGAVEAILFGVRCIPFL